MSALVVAARKYLGVPFRHMGRTPKALDCVGLGWRAYHDCGVDLPVPRFYGREPYRDTLMQALIDALGQPITGEPQLGDVGTFRFRDEPHHVAIIGNAPYGGLTLIHADSSPTVARVVEHRFDAWWLERLTAVFRRPV